MGNGAQRRSEGGKREAEGGKLGGCVELCSPKQSKSNMGRPAVQTGDGNGVLGVIHGDAGMPPPRCAGRALRSNHLSPEARDMWRERWGSNPIQAGHDSGGRTRGLDCYML